MSAAPTVIQEASLRSLLLVGRAHGHEIGTATGFVAEDNGRHYLVTNWHVVAGRSPEDGRPLSRTGAVPDELLVIHNVAGKLGSWVPRAQPLYANGAPLWLEHPAHGRRVDVVALPISATEGVAFYPYQPANPGPPIAMGPSAQISVIGFPFGLTGGGAFGIWVQGTLASEPNIDWNNLPCFLIDSRTRQGQSGSPAILYRSGGYSDEQGNVMVMTGSVERFVGVYSGRIHSESDLGFVWKVKALIEILDGQKRGPLPQMGPPP